MLQPLMHQLATRRIVLASGSPRRKLILENIGLKFEVIPSSFEENLSKSDYDYPYDYVKQTALGKTLEVAKRLASDERIPDLIIGADTVVTLDNDILEKPADKQHAFQLLSRYRGRSHSVYTGVILLTPKQGYRDTSLADGERFTTTMFHESTEVHFDDVDDDTLKAYIETGEPMDKAGGYGIQGEGGTLITKVNGDYFNVMGFPLNKFSRQIVQLHKAGAL